MAVAFVRGATFATPTGQSTTATVPIAINAGENQRYLLAHCAIRLGSSQTIATVLWQPFPIGAPLFTQALTLLTRTPDNGGFRQDIWGLVNPSLSEAAPGGNIIVTLTSGHTATRFVIHAQLFTGVSQSTPEAQFQYRELTLAAGSSIALNLGSTAGDMFVSSMVTRRTFTWTPLSTETESGDAFTSGAGGTASQITSPAEYQLSAGGNFTIGHTFGGSADAMRQCAGQLIQAGGATGVTQTGIVNIESQFGLAIPLDLNIEALAAPFLQQDINIESLLGGVVQTSEVNVEAITSFFQQALINVESLGGVSLAGLINVESLLNLSQQRIINIEAAQGIVPKTAAINIEARGGITQQSIINIEALSAAIGVSQQALINIESLLPLTRQAQLNIEAITNLAARLAVINIEARASLVQTGIVNIESMSGAIISQTALINLESLAGVSAASILNVESNSLATLSRILNIESRGGIFATAVINIESSGTPSAGTFVDAGLPWWWVDASKFKGVSFYIEAQLATNDAVTPKFARARLEESIDLGLNWTPVGGSEISSIHVVKSVPIRSGPLTLTGNKLYRITFGGVSTVMVTIFSGGMYVA